MKYETHIENIDDWSVLDQRVRKRFAEKSSPMTVTLSPGRKRSNKQNKYYWGVVVEEIKDFVNQKGLRTEKGNFITPELVHEALKSEFIDESDRIKFFGIRYNHQASTTELGTKEFAEYTEKIRAHFLHFGLDIPPPPDEVDDYISAVENTPHLTALKTLDPQKKFNHLDKNDPQFKRALNAYEGRIQYFNCETI